MTKKQKQKRDFLKKPHLEGGSDFYKEFLKKNLKYPQDALDNHIEGDVLVSFKVNYKGEVLNPQVIHGLGYGCDEEALRLVKMLKFQEVKNRRVRVTTNNKLKIPFRLRGISSNVSIIYSVEDSKPSKSQNTKSKIKSKPEETYTWTINVVSGKEK